MSVNPQDHSPSRDPKSAEKIQLMIRPEELKRNEPPAWATRRGDGKIVELLKRHGAS